MGAAARRASTLEVRAGKAGELCAAAPRARAAPRPHVCGPAGERGASAAGAGKGAELPRNEALGRRSVAKGCPRAASGCLSTRRGRGSRGRCLVETLDKSPKPSRSYTRPGAARSRRAGAVRGRAAPRAVRQLALREGGQPPQRTHLVQERPRALARAPSASARRRKGWFSRRSSAAPRRRRTRRSAPAPRPKTRAETQRIRRRGRSDARRGRGEAAPAAATPPRETSAEKKKRTRESRDLGNKREDPKVPRLRVHLEQAPSPGARPRQAEKGLRRCGPRQERRARLVPPAERRSCPLVLTLHLAFKRTAPAIQRCKNQQQGRSYAAVLGSASRARMTASLGLVPAFARRRHDQSDAAKIIEIGLRLFFLLRTSKRTTLAIHLQR